MRVFTSIQYVWTGKEYVPGKSESFEYAGEVVRLCGASDAQNSIQKQQMGLSTEAQNQAQQIFKNNTSAYNDLVNTLLPTVQAGAGQQGFTPAELSNLNSQTITNNGVAYRNARAALGNAEAAEGMGGKGIGDSSMPSGVNAQLDANLATTAASNTANQLGGIQEKSYATGRDNYDNAVKGLAGAGSVFNTGTSATGTAAGAGADAASTANQIASQNQSWMGAVSGVLGGVAGAATGGLSNVIGGVAKAAVPSVFNGAQDTLPSGSGNFKFGTDPLQDGPLPSF